MENKNKESFSEFEINITLDVLNRVISFLEKSDNGKFTAETIKLTRDIVLKIKKL